MSALGIALALMGSIGSLGVGFFILKRAPEAMQVRRRAVRERVKIAGRDGQGTLLGYLPALGGGAVLWLLTMVLTGKGGLAFVVGLGGLMIPGWLNEWRETRRLVDLSDQLSRVMGMVSTSLRRGTALEAALMEAARAMPYPLGPVLRNMADATVLGVTLSQAVEQVKSLPAVAGSTDFQVFATEMIICHERGANVVQAFESLRSVLAARLKYRHQVAEHMGQHVMQSLLIASIGLFVMLAYSQMTPEGLSPLLESIAGQLILAFCVLGEVLLIRVTHMSMLKQTRKV